MANKNFDGVLKKLLSEAYPAAPGERPETPVQPTPESDADAWKGSLDKDIDPAVFDAAANPEHAISHQNIEVAKQWVQKIEDFKKFINGLEPDSLHTQINKMDREGSVFRGIVKSEQKKIIKIAEALGSFNEILRSYIISADKKSRELNAQTAKSNSQAGKSE